MKPHHAAALALVGWYLMMPPQPLLPKPIDPNAAPYSPGALPYTVGAPDDDAPISQWSIVEPFDSAAECKAAADDLLRKYAHDKGALAAVHHARCIASDDPRLAK